MAGSPASSRPLLRLDHEEATDELRCARAESADAVLDLDTCLGAHLVRRPGQPDVARAVEIRADIGAHGVATATATATAAGRVRPRGDEQGQPVSLVTRLDHEVCPLARLGLAPAEELASPQSSVANPVGRAILRA